MKKDNIRDYKGKYLSLIGKRFGRLTIDRITGLNIHKKRLSECTCDCGKEVEVIVRLLLTGVVVSCGCKRSEGNFKNIHGMRNTKIYGIWLTMKQRCNNPNTKCYHNYGGKGIKVCDEWESSFESFYEWSIANGYEDDLSIDRINNDKGYSPDNCRWATVIVQANNKRNNRIIRYNGIDYTITQLCNKYNIKRSSFCSVIYKNRDVQKYLDKRTKGGAA